MKLLSSTYIIYNRPLKERTPGAMLLRRKVFIQQSNNRRSKDCCDDDCRMRFCLLGWLTVWVMITLPLIMLGNLSIRHEAYLVRRETLPDFNEIDDIDEKEREKKVKRKMKTRFLDYLSNEEDSTDEGGLCGIV